MFKKNGSTPATACIDYYQNYRYDIWEPWSTTIFFPDRSRVGGVRFFVNTLTPEDPLMKAWEYGMIAYFLAKSRKTFFQSLTKSQKCMFRKIQQVSYP